MNQEPSDIEPQEEATLPTSHEIEMESAEDTKISEEEIESSPNEVTLKQNEVQNDSSVHVPSVAENSSEPLCSQPEQSIKTEEDCAAPQIEVSSEAISNHELDESTDVIASDSPKEKILEPIESVPSLQKNNLNMTSHVVTAKPDDIQLNAVVQELVNIKESVGTHANKSEEATSTLLQKLKANKDGVDEVKLDISQFREAQLSHTQTIDNVTKVVQKVANNLEKYLNQSTSANESTNGKIEKIKTELNSKIISACKDIKQNQNNHELSRKQEQEKASKKKNEFTEKQFQELRKNQTTLTTELKTHQQEGFKNFIEAQSKITGEIKELSERVKLSSEYTTSMVDSNKSSKVWNILLIVLLIISIAASAFHFMHANKIHQSTPIASCPKCTTCPDPIKCLPCTKCIDCVVPPVEPCPKCPSHPLCTSTEGEHRIIEAGSNGAWFLPGPSSYYYIPLQDMQDKFDFLSSQIVPDLFSEFRGVSATRNNATGLTGVIVKLVFKHVKDQINTIVEYFEQGQELLAELSDSEPLSNDEKIKARDQVYKMLVKRFLE
ncbi:hypothetical protein AKO1_014731 [Acrasis kona]|uniref:Uncharacterized protein n=1 Tax=Acrasis kona TaxID=1008807 RepID=A0AAW2Z105_9EUKA